MKKFTKNFLSALLALALVVGFAPGFVSAEEAESETKNVYILHTNDVHARVIGDTAVDENGLTVPGTLIGFARYKAVIDKFREAYPDQVLVLDAGDMIHGTNFATLSKGQSVVRLLNDMGLQAMTTGNHEYNYGKDELMSVVNEADFPILAANVVDENGDKVFEANVILEASGLKIGVFGLATPETKEKSSPANTEGWDFQDPAVVAKEQVAELNEAGADVVVMLCHLGMDEESTDTSFRVLDEVEGIDLVIDGHSHTYLPEGKEYNGTLIASTGNHLENIGVITLTFTDGELTGAAARTIGFYEAALYGEDEDIAASINAIEEENARITEVEVGTLTADLDGEREDVRSKETNLSQMITDAIMAKTEADVVLTNGGGIRASIPAGKVTYGDFLTVLPFGNLVTVIKVTGQDIIDALVHGTDAYPATAGKFPQVAGMTFDLCDHGDDSCEVVNVKVQGEDIDPAAEYTLATNDFMAIGGDGYTMFEGAEQVLLEGLLVDILIEYAESLVNEAGEFSYELGEPRMKLVME